MSEVRRIGSQLKRAFEGGAWHGSSLREILDGVTAEQAAARPGAAAHSIWEIVLHIDAWQRAATRVVEGGAMPALSDEEDWPAPDGSGEEAWRAARSSLLAGNKRLRDALRGVADADLEGVVAGREYNLYFLLHGIIQHSLYHAGQAALLRRLLTTRQPETGGL